ncbi:hypothetical protein D3C83_107350 [compost metagenome]
MTASLLALSVLYNLPWRSASSSASLRSDTSRELVTISQRSPKRSARRCTSNQPLPPREALTPKTSTLTVSPLRAMTSR